MNLGKQHVPQPVKRRKSDSMRLCVIGDGRSVHTQRWVEYFAGRHEVHLITYDPMERTIPGVQEHVLQTVIPGLHAAFWPRHIRIIRLVRKIRPDLIHAHFITKYGFHLALLGFHPSVLSAWGDDVLILPPQSTIIRAFTHLALRRADRIYAVSRDIRSRIISDFTISPDKVRHLPFGVDTAIFQPGHHEESADPTITVFSNRGFQPVYDNETLVRGFAGAYAVNPSLRLILKGEGSQKEEIVGLVHRLGIESVVTFLRRGEYQEVATDLQAADIFVTTAVSDGTPVSLLEAMAAGLPCIATAVGGIPEWIRDGENGLMIRPKEPALVGEKILMLAGDEQKRRTFGMNARKCIEDSGDWWKLMKNAEDDYLALIRQYGGRGE
jgi:glycosyltransferase involved in cell wall biosynthesis